MAEPMATLAFVVTVRAGTAAGEVEQAFRVLEAHFAWVRHAQYRTAPNGTEKNGEGLLIYTHSAGDPFLEG